MRLDLKIAFLTSGKTQRQVAFEKGIPEGRLSGIVRGWSEPSEREQHAIAEALGKSADELFGCVESGARSG